MNDVSPLVALKAHVLNLKCLELLKDQDYQHAIIKGEEFASLVENEGCSRTQLGAVAWNNLGAAYSGAGDLDRAETALHRAAEISEEVLGAGHPNFAIDLSKLCDLYRARGEFAQAIQYGARALAIMESALDDSDARLGTALNNLSQAYMFSGDFTSAEPLLRRSLAVAIQGGDGEAQAVAHKNLADILLARNQFRAAGTEYGKAQELFEQTLGPKHPLVSVALTGRARTSWEVAGHFPPGARENALEEVEELLLRARQIAADRLGEGHSQVLIADADLALLARELGRTDEGLKQMAAVRERAIRLFGPEHPESLKIENNYASFLSSCGHLNEAKELYLRRIESETRRGDPNSTGLFAAWHNLMFVLLQMGDIPGAVDAARAANRVEDHMLSQVLRGSVESGRAAFISSLNSRLQAVLSLHVDFAPQDPEALELAATSVLRRKGRSLDVMATSMHYLRDTFTAEARAGFDEYRRVAAKLASLGVSGADSEQGELLQRQLREIEDRLSSESGAFREAGEEPATVAAIQNGLPPGSALVEIVRSFKLRPDRGQSVEETWDLHNSRYVAYVVRPNIAPQFVELASDEIVRDLCLRFRQAIVDRAPIATVLAGRLYQAAFAPIERLVDGATTLYISPDGPLNVIPFAALCDASGSRLVERWSIDFLQSGRNLLKFGKQPAPRSAPVVVANPHFGRSADGLQRFAALPATRVEASIVAAKLKQATVLMESSATKSALSELHGPRVLHFATHGFFESSPATHLPGDDVVPTAMLASGIALCGANEDFANGILTAQEIIGLDLVGTRLAVLSACESGVGDTEFGHDMYGLTRALSIAGAQAQLATLWVVDDTATTKFMEEYYAQLSRGVPKPEALRHSQLQLMSDPSTRDPIFWAAFIALGDPEPIDLLEPLRATGRQVVARRPNAPTFPESFFLEPIAKATLRAERINEIPNIKSAVERELFGIARLEMREQMFKIERHDGIGVVPRHVLESLTALGDLLGNGQVGRGFRFHLQQVRVGRDVKGLSMLWERAIAEADASGVPPPRAQAPAKIESDEMLCGHCGGIQKRHYKFCLRCNQLLRPAG